MQLPFAYTVPGTRIRVLTRKQPAELSIFDSVLAADAPRAQNCGEPLRRVR
jgi:hypothetical protein